MPSKGDFPGLQRSSRKDGTVALHWVCTQKAREAGYEPKTVNLCNFPEGSIPLSTRCKELQAQMESWLAGLSKPGKRLQYNGTMGSLLTIYETHEYSPYQRLTRYGKETPITSCAN